MGLPSEAWKHEDVVRRVVDEASEDGVLEVSVVPAAWADLLFLMRARRRMKDDLRIAEATFAAQERVLSPLDKCLCSKKYESQIAMHYLDRRLDVNKARMALLSDGKILGLGGRHGRDGRSIIEEEGGHNGGGGKRGDSDDDDGGGDDDDDGGGGGGGGGGNGDVTTPTKKEKMEKRLQVVKGFFRDFREP